jgi:hypothetical protein
LEGVISAYESFSKRCPGMAFNQIVAPIPHSWNTLTDPDT